MKFFTNKDWEIYQDVHEHELNIYKLRNLKLEYLEKLFETDFKSMNIEQIDKWFVDRMTQERMKNFQLFYRQGAISGVNSLCDTLEKYDLVSDAIVNEIREGLIKKLNEDIKELDN